MNSRVYAFLLPESTHRHDHRGSRARPVGDGCPGGPTATRAKLRAQYGRKLKQVYSLHATKALQLQGPKNTKTDFTIVGRGENARVVSINIYVGKSRF